MALPERQNLEKQEPFGRTTKGTDVPKRSEEVGFGPGFQAISTTF